MVQDGRSSSQKDASPGPSSGLTCNHPTKTDCWHTTLLGGQGDAVARLAGRSLRVLPQGLCDGRLAKPCVPFKFDEGEGIPGVRHWTATPTCMFWVMVLGCGWPSRPLHRVDNIGCAGRVVSPWTARRRITQYRWTEVGANTVSSRQLLQLQQRIQYHI